MLCKKRNYEYCSYSYSFSNQPHLECQVLAAKSSEMILAHHTLSSTIFIFLDSGLPIAILKVVREVTKV